MQKLGVFDSGIGGFNIVSELRKHTDINIVFLADHKNLPYGNKEDEELKAILLNNMQWFVDKKINHVLIACNTASTYIDYLRESFPQMKIDSIIEITAAQFIEDKPLMIFGTKKTVTSMVYNRHLKSDANYLALSDLASLVELNNQEVIKEYLEQQLKGIKLNQDFLLACTHYSIVKDLFESILNKEVYDSVLPTIKHYKDYRGEYHLEVYSSGNIKVLKDQLLDIFNYDVKVNPKDDEYKIVVVSDNHGRYAPISEVLADNKDASAFIHCGDVELEPELVSDFYAVSGNNDYFNNFPKHLILEIGRLRVYVTHGDEHMRYKRIDNIYKDGINLKADIICYGHEHVYEETWIDGLLLLNPGSLFYNRDNSAVSYAILTVTPDSYKVKRVNIQGDV